MAFSSWRTWVTGEVVTAAHMNQEVRDNGEALFPDEVVAISWTPTLEATGTNPTTSATTGRQYRIGALRFVYARWVLSANGVGAFFVTLPDTVVGLTASVALGKGQTIGSWHARDDSGSTAAGGEVLLGTSTTAFFELSWFTPGGQRSVDDDTPWVWASGDVISFSAVCPIA